MLKDAEWSDHLRHKKKRELQVSLPLKKGPHTLDSENTNTDLSKKGDGSKVTVFKIKAKLPARALHH